MAIFSKDLNVLQRRSIMKLPLNTRQQMQIENQLNQRKCIIITSGGNHHFNIYKEGSRYVSTGNDKKRIYYNTLDQAIKGYWIPQAQENFQTKAKLFNTKERRKEIINNYQQNNFVVSCITKGELDEFTFSPFFNDDNNIKYFQDTDISEYSQFAPNCEGANERFRRYQENKLQRQRIQEQQRIQQQKNDLINLFQQKWKCDRECKEKWNNYQREFYNGYNYLAQIYYNKAIEQNKKSSFYQNEIRNFMYNNRANNELNNLYKQLTNFK